MITFQDTQNVIITRCGVASRKEEKGKLARPARSTTEEGIGDVLLKVSYAILEEKALIPEIAPYVKIKFPTADETRGLGTGEYDETIGVDLSKRRSEEHTSELQSLAYLVCRLLLEKKKHTRVRSTRSVTG